MGRTGGEGGGSKKQSLSRVMHYYLDCISCIKRNREVFSVKSKDLFFIFRRLNYLIANLNP